MIHCYNEHRWFGIRRENKCAKRREGGGVEKKRRWMEEMQEEEAHGKDWRINAPTKSMTCPPGGVEKGKKPV